MLIRGATYRNIVWTIKLASENLFPPKILAFTYKILLIVLCGCFEQPRKLK